MLTAAVTLVNALWVLRDSTAPSWDQSHYLNLTWYYQQALDHHGPGALFHAIYTSDPARAPLLSVLMLPFSYVFGPGPGMGLALDTALWPVLLLSAGAVAKELFDDRARLLAIAVLAPMPLVVTLSHNVLQDFLVLTLTTLAVLLLVRSRRFSNAKACVGLGVVTALGLLTKFSFPVGLGRPGPRDLGGRGRRVVAAPGGPRATGGRPGWACATWPWWRCWRSSRPWLGTCRIGRPPDAYLRSQYTPQPGSVADPLAPGHIAAFLINTGSNMAWLTVGLAVVVGLASLPRLVRWVARHGARRHDVYTGTFVSAWFLVPVAVVMASTTQDPRYVIAAYPALAVSTAGLISGTGRPARAAAVHRGRRGGRGDPAPRGERRVLPRCPVLPAALSAVTPYGTITVQLSGADGPAVPPLPRNYTLDVSSYLESKSRGPGARIEPKVIDIAELHEYMNGNDLTYYALVRHDPFTFVTLDTTMSPAALAASVRAADFVLYIRQPPLGGPGTSGRIGELNGSAAARSMTPAMFALFGPDPRRIFVGTGTDEGPFVAVLQRR